MPNPPTYVVIGSGFGGSVSALRLAQKGYRVIVIEKGKWYKAEDFPRTNWQLRRWLWLPALRWFGIMKITIFRHVGFLTGHGVGGGSLVYANTLPMPKKAFFKTGSWAGLADWEQELAPYYAEAKRMLGAAPNPVLFDSDKALLELSRTIGREAHFSPTEVAVYFGKAGKTAPDPYFNGQGPERTGCTFCGACMTGCRIGAKNTLDKNYLYLAQQFGAQILAEHEVTDVRPAGSADGADGYTVTYQPSTRIFPKKITLHADGVVFAGGVLGTVKLLLKLKKSSLPKLSDMVGHDIRTNNESLIGITRLDNDKDLSKGIAIGSILHTDEHTHLEMVRYGAGSGAWKFTFMPYVEGPNALVRLLKITGRILSQPLFYLRGLLLKDWAKNTTILLLMQTLDSTIRFRLSPGGRMRSEVHGGQKPSAFIPQAGALARQFEQILQGKSGAFFLTPTAGIPGTAHILGGAVMGADPSQGVIDKNNRVFGYQNMFVCDGSMISANPGVNPSLSITAIAEKAMAAVETQQTS